MVRKFAALSVVVILSLPSCSKGPNFSSGTAYLKLKEPVWATYGWSNKRLAYIIYFVPGPSLAFNAEGLAAVLKTTDKVDVFEGALDGYTEKSRAPFRSEPKKGELVFESRTFRMANGNVFLINVGSPSKVQQLQVAPLPWPKDPEETPAYLESEVRRILKENPKISEFPKEPAAPDKTKKK
jgi:hypothetical protein